MSKEKKKFATWEEVIVDFFEYKVRESKLYKARKYVENKDVEIKAEKDANKKEKLVRKKIIKEKELEKLRSDAPVTEIRKWISQTSKKKIGEGKRIIKATHVLRFTHSSSDSAGCFLDEKAKENLLTTASLINDIPYDMAHNNGNLITISRFLAIRLFEDPIIDNILRENYSFLMPFCEDKKQLEEWKKGFSKLVERREIKTADKAKQIYFPIPLDVRVENGDKYKYHLIVPLFSSTLAEKIYSKQTNIRFSEEQIEVRNRRNDSKNNNYTNSKYHKKSYDNFPNLAIQKFGGDNPQNVSMLNTSRNGKSYLFSSEPPAWQYQLKPPIKKRSLFAAFFSQRANKEINYLREFLLRFQRFDLSIKDPKKKKWIDSWTSQIIEEVMAYTFSIQNLLPGWSNTQNIRLKLEHQYFLDPYCDDEVFQKERQSKDWQAVICNDFAHWLNGRLKGKDKKFTPQREHTRMWKYMMEKEIREHTQMIDADIKFQNREKQA